ncbi:hypothetical protein UPYG_G00059130 [Umbra pygmaea]|uniref:Immunoglobulin domain-containing protein n=1 Tax=Umbra pygmaea TaxID=75934 RepID=A0ABD0X8X5_UMBPY
MRILLIFTVLCFTTGHVSLFSVTGFFGGTVIIYCQYDNKHISNDKYFCMGPKYSWNCKDNIRTGAKNTWYHNGRFSLYDDTEVNYFMVVIRQLTRQDEGTYWCGVDISVIADSYNKVELEVKEGECCKNSGTEMAYLGGEATIISSMSPLTSGTPVLTLVCVSVVVLLIVIIFIMLYTWKYIKTTGSVPSTQRGSSDRGNKDEDCHGDDEYEEIKEPPESETFSATTTIYATTTLPSKTFDSPYYASVKFNKNLCYHTAAISKEGTSSCVYTTVDVGQSSTYSVVNHPHSSTETPPVYSTINKPRDT